MDLSKEKSEGDINLSENRKDWQDDNLDSRTREILEEDSKYFLHQSLSTPCLNALEHCQGIHLTDFQGRSIMDFHGNSVHQVGFGHPEVIEAIKNQLDELPFCTRRYTNSVAVDFAKKLTEVAPGNLNKVLLTPGGTSAIGIALKLARLITGRHKTISMWDSFHGASLDAISIGGESIFRNGVGPLLPGAEHVPPPDENHCLWDCKERGGCDLKCADYIEYILEKEGDVAAVIAEPIRSTPYVPPPDYWKKVKAACEKHGAMLILDEIYQGLGRTGKMFACEHFDVVPDILVLGKGLGGGVFPLAAIITKEEYDVLGDRALGHYTHEKNPVACAAGLATLNIIENEKLVSNASVLGQYTLEKLRELKEKHSIISDVRGIGLILGVELSKNNERACDEAEKVMYEALSRGLSFKITMGNILLLSPPLTVTKEDMDKAVHILDESISNAVK
jgi:(R)-1-hydroxy-2-aminoethylphosphonate ammonia-lyase